jgi:hypothetical protein
MILLTTVSHDRYAENKQKKISLDRITAEVEDRYHESAVNMPTIP